MLPESQPHQKTFLSVRHLFILIIALFQSGIVTGQCMMIPLSLEYQTSGSDLIIEGVVREKSAFVNQAGNYIYTTYLIEITKIFKGQSQKSTVQVVESGGIVGDRVVEVTPSISLEIGQTGTFFLELYTFRDPQDRLRFQDPVYRAYASSQSIFKYDFTSNMVNGFFNQFELDGWYDVMRSKTGAVYIELKTLSRPTQSHSRFVPTITTMSPLTITAGTFSVLTITGNGFGSPQGTSTVEFKNADDGGASWLIATTPHIVSWSNTQIQVKVPYQAGSGQVRVTVGGSPVTSSQSLSIAYDQYNVTFDISGVPTLFKRHLYNNNGTGGYTYRYHTEFNTNTPARKSFERALNSWRCATAVNFIIGDVTTLDIIADDGTNIVRFDNGNEIPEGVAAQTSSYYVLCVNIVLFANQVKEIDLVFNDSFTGLTWEYGPDLPTINEVDFESVALHELGHAGCLGHVISPPEVMHYSISNGESKRVLSVNDIAGGAYVHAQSTGNGFYCSRSAMTDYRQVKYVNINTTGIESGDTWAQAYKKLQDALSLITGCVDTIYVATGRYYPDDGVGLTNNDQALRFVLNSTTVLMGGYSASTGVRNLSTSASILSGDIDQDSVANDTDNSRNVVRMSAAAHLDGFYIEYGYADLASGEGRDGAGMYCSANGVIRNCIFRKNIAPGAAGGLGRGGAVYLLSGSPVFQNVLMYNNAAALSGNAVYITNGTMQCQNCTIVSNNLANSLPAMKVDAGAQQFKNSIFWNNTSDMTISGGSVDVTNSMLQSASLPSGASGSNVLFNTNPLFVNLAGINLALTQCSPAVNTGDNTFNTSTKDILGNTRVVGGTIDRGAYENTSGWPPTIVTNLLDIGAGSLRTIIADACAGHTITFSNTLMNQTILLTGPQIDLDKNLIIEGLGLDQITISAAGTHRHFSLNAGITATIKKMTLSEGNASAPTGNCIRNLGILTLDNIRLKKALAAPNPITLSTFTGATTTLLNQVFVQ